MYINYSNGWTYVKHNNTVYVLNNLPVEKDVYKNDIIEKLGVIEKNTFEIFKPIINNSSNGIPVGTEIFKVKNSNGILIELNEMYLYLGSTDDEGWGNSPKVKVKDNQIVWN